MDNPVTESSTAALDTNQAANLFAGMLDRDAEHKEEQQQQTTAHQHARCYAEETTGNGPFLFFGMQAVCAGIEDIVDNINERCAKAKGKEGNHQLRFSEQVNPACKKHRQKYKKVFNPVLYPDEGNNVFKYIRHLDSGWFQK